jgi:hypothetical protein
MGFAERFAYRLYVILSTKKTTIPNRLLQGAGLRLRNAPSSMFAMRTIDYLGRIDGEHGWHDGAIR